MSRQPWTLPDHPEERLALAKGYPYGAPARSYLFQDGAAHPLDAGGGDDLWAGRWAVIGHGSNRAPEQLARKFRHFSGDASRIPVTYVWLAGYDVVYSAHVTTYGAIASNLTHAPGCRVRVALTWLTAQQLERMHETEGNYAFGRLQGVELETEAGPDARNTDIHMYLSDHGCLLDPAGRPIGLDAVEAADRPHPAMDQPAVQRLVRDRLDGQADLDTFILHAVADGQTRWQRIQALKAHRRESHVPHFVTVQG
jgi:hypothetical protein